MAGNVVEELIKSIQQEPKKQSRAVAAVVARVDGEGVVWVRLAGSEQETPTASVSTEVKPGDIVTVEWRNKKLYIGGNYSNPSAGMQRILITEANMNATTNLVGTFDKKVDNLMRITGDTTQYFWHTETGTDTGAHITEIPKDNFLEDPENGGSNLLARSNGIAVRYGLAELARFGADGVQIGQDGQTRSMIGSYSMQMVDKDDNVYFLVEDRRRDGIYVFSEENDNVDVVYPYSSTIMYSNYDIDTNYPVTVKHNGVEVAYTSIGHYRINDDRMVGVIYGTGFDVDGTYSLSYTTRDPVHSMRFGARTEATAPNAICFAQDGKASYVNAFAVGDSTTASGSASFASGKGSVSRGRNSFSAGEYSYAIGESSLSMGSYCQADGANAAAFNQGTTAKGDNSFVVGKFNKSDTNNAYAFIIGNGTYNSNRSNALTVDWNGNLNCAGSITSAAGSSTRFTFSSNVSGAVNPLAYGYKDNVAKTVRIYFTARYNSNVASGTTIFTVPEGYRPSANSPVMVSIRMEDGTMNPAYLTINTSGAIVQNFTSFCRGIVGHAEYSI